MTGNYGMDRTLRRFTIILALSFATVDCLQEDASTNSCSILGLLRSVSHSQGRSAVMGLYGEGDAYGDGSTQGQSKRCRADASGVLRDRVDIMLLIQVSPWFTDVASLRSQTVAEVMIAGGASCEGGGSIDVRRQRRSDHATQDGRRKRGNTKSVLNSCVFSCWRGSWSRRARPDSRRGARGS